MSSALIALAVTSCACGWRSDGLARLEELYPTPSIVIPDAGNSAPIDLGDPKCSGFAGNWAVRLVQVGTIAPVGEVWKMTITDLFLAESSGTAMDLKFCDQNVSIVSAGQSLDLGRPKASAALKEVLGRTPVRLPVPQTGFAAQDIVWLWGLKNLVAPLTDPLPTKDDFTNDPRVWDEDDDGQPGVTLGIVAPAGDRYMVRRAIWNFEPGKLSLSNAWITGALGSKITENGLGATNSLLLTPAPITPKAEGSVYQLRCVGATYTCAALAKDQAVLFKDAPH